MRLRGLHSALRPAGEWALSVADHYRVPVQVTSVFRSWEEQERLRARWERGQSRWPAARPGHSAHQYGFAWDSWVPEPFEDWWKAVREHAGFEVLTGDEIHAQLPNWREYVVGWPRSG